VADFWLKRVMQSQQGAMDTDAYAASVVRMLQRRNVPHWFWSGAKSTLVWMLYYLLPRWVRMRIMARQFGLVNGALG
jgi:1-acylglycerone phosphate reductase